MAKHYFALFSSLSTYILPSYLFFRSVMRLMGKFCNNKDSTTSMSTRFAYSFVSLFLLWYLKAKRAKKKPHEFSLLARRVRPASPICAGCNAVPKKKLLFLQIIYCANPFGATLHLLLHLFFQKSPTKCSLLTGNMLN